MTRFSYRGLAAKGEIMQGSLDARTMDDVRRHLETKHLIPIEITVEPDDVFQTEPVGNSLFSQIGRFFRKPDHHDITNFIQNLGILLEASVRLDQALTLLEASEMSGSLSDHVRHIRAAVMAGESLSVALAREPDLFPKSMVALIHLSEQAGMLPRVLLAIAKERTKAFRLRQKAIDGLQYPAILLAAAFAVLVFFISFVLPQFAPVLIEMGAKADPTLVSLLKVSLALNAHRFIAISALIASILTVILVLRNDDRRARWFSVMTRLPGARSLYRDYITAIFCRNFNHLISNGVSVADAINLVGQSVARPESQAAWTKARDDVRHGERAFDALTRIGDLSPTALRMIRIGEEMGQMPTLVHQAADLFEERFERNLEKLIGVVGPLAIVVVSVVIGGLIVSVMSALMSINELAR